MAQFIVRALFPNTEKWKFFQGIVRQHGYIPEELKILGTQNQTQLIQEEKLNYIIEWLNIVVQTLFSTTPMRFPVDSVDLFVDIRRII